jgi:hypothetical protein
MSMHVLFVAVSLLVIAVVALAIPLRTQLFVLTPKSPLWTQLPKAGDFIGNGAALRRMRNVLQAHTNPVLVIGRRGAGKSFVTNIVAKELELPVLRLEASEFIPTYFLSVPALLAATMIRVALLRFRHGKQVALRIEGLEYLGQLEDGEISPATARLAKFIRAYANKVRIIGETADPGRMHPFLQMHFPERVELPRELSRKERARFIDREMRRLQEAELLDTELAQPGALRWFVEKTKPLTFGEIEWVIAQAVENQRAYFIATTHANVDASEDPERMVAPLDLVYVNDVALRRALGEYLRPKRSRGIVQDPVTDPNGE